MTASATRHARAKSARLAILRELHGSGFIAASPEKPAIIDALIDDGLVAMKDGWLAVTKAGLTELAEESRCGTS